ncbi:MAG: Chaperone SurA precursor [Syntrophorhabdus sp. PtaB.Bin047]|jgi:peptidyl-prolyl cis-trans isomerase SurA|nr:MAG: Chaperone SurA precursor [Syntrophorhabdus sp. PtaB.Bin047]
MKRISTFIIAATIMVLTGLCAEAEVIDRVIAIINDDIVTLKDFEAYVKIEKRTRFTSIDEYFRNLQMKDRLEAYVEGVLVKQQAKKMGIVATDSEVEGFIEGIKKQNLITDAELREQLRKDNVTYEQFKEGVRLNILRTRLLVRVVSTEISVTEASLKSYYESHQELFREEEFHLQQIFVSAQHPDIRERAEKAYTQLTSGTPFADVARSLSDDPSAKQGGDIGFVKRSDLMPTLRDGLNSIQPGSFTQVIPTQYGLHILKLIEVKRAEVLPYEEVKKTVNDRMVMEESNKRYRDYMDKLKKTSYIEIKI